MMNHDNPVKGVGFGIQVIEEIKKIHANIKVRMFGKNDNSNLPAYVEYFHDPSKDELTRLYQDADIFLFPSISDGWGLTPIEAMACGCAVVGTRTGFVLDLGKHGENMMISDVGDVQSMISNVNELLNDRQLLSRIQQNAYNDIQSLKWETSAEKLIKELHR